MIATRISRRQRRQLQRQRHRTSITFFPMMLISYLVLSNIIIAVCSAYSNVASAFAFTPTIIPTLSSPRSLLPLSPLSSSSSILSLCATNDDDNNNNNNDFDDIFQGIKKFFLGNDQEKLTSSKNDSNMVQTSASSSPSSSLFSNSIIINDDDDELPAGTTLLLKITATQLKPGGLRLFLMFYLLGMQNSPERGTWRADQKLLSTPAHSTSKVDNYEEQTTLSASKAPAAYVLEMLYDIDRTGMLQIELTQSSSSPSGTTKAKTTDDNADVNGGEIRLYRCGSRPSTSYLMQESVIIDGLLEELQQIAGIDNNQNKIVKKTEEGKSIQQISSSSSKKQKTDENDKEEESPIADKDRLLIPEPINAIEIARESLAFG